MKGVKITKRTVDAAKPGARDRFLWDTKLPGFGLKITPKGTRIYVFQYTRGPRKRRITIGRHGAPWTPDKARTEALGYSGEVADGGDPAARRALDRRVPTFEDFATRYLEEHAEPKKKPSSLREDRRLIEHILKPRIGDYKLNDITRADVTPMHLALRSTPTQANRALALLSKMMNLAEAWGLRPDGTNPCRHVEKYKERRCERFLSEEELQRLGEALAQAERDQTQPLFGIAAIRFLALTGCRLSEALELRWEYVDLKRACLRLPDSKTGAKVVQLGAPAVELLIGLPRVDENPHVFPGQRRGKHFVALPQVWAAIRKEAKLEDVRLHDLRHSFASVGASGGIGLPVLGSLLGHREASTTQRYAHLSNDPVRAAADRIAASINAAMERKSGEIVRFKEAHARRTASESGG